MFKSNPPLGFTTHLSQTPQHIFQPSQHISQPSQHITHPPPQQLAHALRSKLDQARRFEVPKRPQHAFVIDHYAGKVCYSTEYLLEKNKVGVVVVVVVNDYHRVEVFLCP